MGETERGCGWRKAGGVYLVCNGTGYTCDALPVEMVPCPCCEFEVGQARSMQPVRSGYMAFLMKNHKCKEEAGFICPVCFYAKEYPKMKEILAELDEDSDEYKELKAQIPAHFYLMFVSKEFYTPESFINEAHLQGVSKRVAPNSLPKGFRVGTDWVFLAHGEVPFKKTIFGDMVEVEDETRFGKGIFYAFRPERLEVVLYKGVDPELILDYEEAGYTVVLLERTEANIEKHGDKSPPPLPYGFKRNKSRSKGKSKNVKTEKKNE